jgi:hypothetical protein
MPWLALDPDPPVHPSWVAGMTGVHHHAQLFIGLANFLPKQKV